MPSEAITREKAKEYKLSAWIEDATNLNLQKYCDKHDRTKSRVVEMALKEFLGMRRRSSRKVAA